MSTHAAAPVHDDARVDGYDPLIPPQLLQVDIPLSERCYATVDAARRACADVLAGASDRLIVVVGPCSIHDVSAALEYGGKLKAIADRLSEDLVVIMRSYFEKPRTTVGWKGLINDPDLDGSFHINKGLKKARTLLRDLTESGMPVGFELLDTISPQFLADCVSWGAVGARTTESQLHRELASGVSFPVGFKNGTDGNVKIALDAIRAAAHPHHFLGVTKQGLTAITRTRGNDSCHIILRGGNDGPNFSAAHIQRTRDALKAAGLKPTIMVDCSHGNSQKKHENQPLVAKDLAEQIAAGDASIVGVMIESNLFEGRQDIPKEGPAGLAYGKSITDACVGWADTVEMLDTLAAAVRKRRAAKA